MCQLVACSLSFGLRLVLLCGRLNGQRADSELGPLAQNTPSLKHTNSAHAPQQWPTKSRTTDRGRKESYITLGCNDAADLDDGTCGRFPRRSRS